MSKGSSGGGANPGAASSGTSEYRPTASVLNSLNQRSSRELNKWEAAKKAGNNEKAANHLASSQAYAAAAKAHDQGNKAKGERLERIAKAYSTGKRSATADKAAYAARKK